MTNKTIKTIEQHILQHQNNQPTGSLPITINGENFTVYGGSCHHTDVPDVNLFLSLDTEQPVYDWEQPWHNSFNQFNRKHLRFPIIDMFIPDNSQQFMECIKYVSEEIKKGLKVHIGCLGGNGRTGLFLAALIQYNMSAYLSTLKKDSSIPSNAIEYVRKFYSTKSVETVPQLIFLQQAFNINYPDKELDKVIYFKNIFQKEIGVSLDHMLSQNVPINELFGILKIVDDAVYQSKIIKTTTLKNRII